jgi:hypothetical protein
MQVPYERPPGGARAGQSFWREYFAVLSLTLVALAGAYLILGALATVLLFSLALTALLVLV